MKRLASGRAFSYNIAPARGRPQPAIISEQEAHHGDDTKIMG